MEIQDQDALKHPAVIVVLDLLRADLRVANEAGDKARARLSEAQEVIRTLTEWTHIYGAALRPPGADTYGNGVRDCKQQVARLLAKDRTFVVPASCRADAAALEGKS